MHIAGPLDATDHPQGKLHRKRGTKGLVGSAWTCEDTEETLSEDASRTKKEGSFLGAGGYTGLLLVLDH